MTELENVVDFLEALIEDLEAFVSHAPQRGLSDRLDNCASRVSAAADELRRR